MRVYIGKIILSCFTVFLIAAMLYSEYHLEIKEKENSLYFVIEENIIKTWKKDKIQYLFLPSYVKEEEVFLASFSPEFYVLEEGETIQKEESIKGLPQEKKLLCQTVESKEHFTLYILQSSNLATMHLYTNNHDLDKIKEDKEYGVAGSIQTIDQDGEHSRKIGVKEIRGRGNTSFAGYEKKPYSLTLKEEESILGLPAGEKYALLSNASDPSLIRNDLVRRMEEELNLRGAHRGRFVDLYIDGLYEGNYYLCDDIEVGTERVNIENMEEAMDLVYTTSNYEAEPLYETEKAKARRLDISLVDMTGGYLMEREYSQRFFHEYEKIKSGFITQQQEHFVVKSPSYCSVEQIEYLRSYINEAEEAILDPRGINEDTKKSYTDYIDIHSFVKKYLAEEVSKNYDGGVSSSYFYKDSDKKDGKLYAAYGWDYDMSLGNYVEWMEEFSSNPEGISKLSHHTYSSPWYENLYEKEEFYQLVKEYYADKVSPFLGYLVEVGLNEYERWLYDSAIMNEIRWKEELLKNPYFVNREKTFSDLTDFIEKRKKYLDQEWIE